MTDYPVFDAANSDADHLTVANPIGHAATPEGALLLARHYFATCVDEGEDESIVDSVELRDRNGIKGWFPVWA